MIVLFQDECHLVWGQRNTPLSIPIPNERQHQTYYGTVNLLTREIVVQPFPSGKGEFTVEFLRGLRDYYGGKPIILLWDAATYHRDAHVKALLSEINANLPEPDWQLTCLRFAPNAPDQNPIEDIWLQAKNFLRKHFVLNKTFAQVKFDGYTPNPQSI